MSAQRSPTQSGGSSRNLPPKRILPPRERRESAIKREAASPVPAPCPTVSKGSNLSKSTPKNASYRASKRKAPPTSPPRRRPPTPPPLPEEVPPPTEITDTRPLPAAPKSQLEKPYATAYQSIAESGVLAASLSRSRMKWLSEGILERYWSKPSKKKGTEVVPANPDPKSMHKLGSCTIIIGPHTFEAMVFTVRDNVSHHPINQYPPRSTASPYPVFSPHQNLGASTVQPQVDRAIDPSRREPETKVKSEHSVHNGLPAQSVSLPPPPSPPVSQPLSERPPVQAAPQSGPDPVIRMLATRAATNPDLKALMRIVASSSATPEQLRLFQSHIDELNVVLRLQQEAEYAAAHPKSQVEPNTYRNMTTEASHDSHFADAPIVTSGDTGDTGFARPHRQLPPIQPPQHLAIASRPVERSMNPTTAPPQSAPPLKMAHSESLVKAIVLEITTPASALAPASQDRYLFPEYAVLDTIRTPDGLEMICSFLITRRGEDLLAPASMEGAASSENSGPMRWKASAEYYQPVTMRLRTSQPRIFETIARAARPLGEVQAKMTEIMQTKSRVKDEWLVLRLPREKEVNPEAMQSCDAGFVDSAVEMNDAQQESADEDDELKAFYGI